jgi:hypothetical protein
MTPTIDSWRNEFHVVVGEIFGLYLDATSGFDHLLAKLQEVLNVHPSPETASFRYGDGDPNSPNAKELHSVPIRDLKKRLGQDSDDYIHIANYCIVTLFQFWEGEFRPRLAELRRVTIDEIQVDEWGDLRILRNAIIHNKGVANSDVAKMKVFRWFSDGLPISLTKTRFKSLIETLNKAIDTTL